LSGHQLPKSRKSRKSRKSSHATMCPEAHEM
jgi:hypothetical protein